MTFLGDDAGAGSDAVRYTYTSTYAYTEEGQALNWIFRTTLVYGNRLLYLYHIDMPQQKYRKEAKNALRQRALDALGLDSSGKTLLK